MDASRRKDFLKRHGLGFAGLVIIYVILTIVRDFRDNFIVEFWSELGYSDQPQLITLTEIPIALVVLVISALGILIIDNRKAFNLGIYATAVSAVIMFIVTYLFKNDQVSPIVWMITSGTSIYLPYILFHCLLFERFIALLRYKGTVGYLFYVADAIGYLASVGILILKEIIDYRYSWVNFFIKLNINGAASILIVSCIAIWVLHRKECFIPSA